MNTIVVDFLVKKPRAVVFGAFMNPDLLPKWMTGFVSLELLSGEAGQVGTIYKLTYLENGTQVSLKETITTVRENEEYAFVMTGSGMKAEIRFTFSDDGSYTRVRVENNFSGNNIGIAFMLKMMKGKIRKRQEADMDNFRRLVESDEF